MTFLSLDSVYIISMEFCPFYHMHLLLPIEILKQRNAQVKRECWGKKAVPRVDDGAVSWFFFDIGKESTENQWRLRVALYTQKQVHININEAL